MVVGDGVSRSLEFPEGSMPRTARTALNQVRRLYIDVLQKSMANCTIITHGSEGANCMLAAQKAEAEEAAITGGEYF